MKELDVILPRILLRAKGCPEPVALAGIREAARLFCERTRLWREEDVFTVSASPGSHVVCAPYGAAVFEIEHATLDGTPLEPVSISWLNEHIHQWESLTGGLGRYITQTAPDSVIVVPASAGELTLKLTLTVTDDATRLPDWLLTQYRQVLIDGALADIFSVPEAAYSNLPLASFHGGQFYAALDRLSAASIRGQQRAPVRSKPHYF